MSIKTLALILISVCLSAFAQVALKHGMSAATMQDAVAGGLRPELLVAVSTSPGVLAGLVMYVSSVGFWLLVLSDVDVSQAYPFVGLGFLLTMAFAMLFLGEAVGPARLAGTLLVAVGVALVARS
jgi:multidrug transporter EmrE-like cation transporter